MEANDFTILWWFLPYTDMNQPRVYTCLPSWTPLPPPFPSHPSGLSQCFECPVSRIELGLVICFTYGDIHISVLFSQIIPPSPSPIESKSVFFISVWRRQTFSLVEDTAASVSDKILPFQKVTLWARLLCPAHKSASGSPQISYFSGAYILLQNI